VDGNLGSAKVGFGIAGEVIRRKAKETKVWQSLKRGFPLRISIFSHVLSPLGRSLRALLFAWSGLAEGLNLVSGLPFVLSSFGEVSFSFAMAVSVRIEVDVVPFLDVFVFFFMCFCSLTVDLVLARSCDLSMLRFGGRHGEWCVSCSGIYFDNSEVV
jgi:hypothetical protein